MLVTVDEAKLYLRLDGTEEDALIQTLLETAESLCQDIVRTDFDEMDKVSKDINNAIPTDFDVDARVGANTQTSGSGSGGTVITYTGPLVSVAQMVVRSEDDIRKVSQGLYNLMQSGTRAQGIIPIT